LDKEQMDKAVKKEITRLRASLDELWEDLCINGNTEMFSQSDKTEPYERERPAARLFNSRDKNYQAIIKQLNDKLPEDKVNDVSEEILKFALQGKK